MFKRALSTHPKFYLFDAGVFRSLRPKGPLHDSSEINGLALEGLVAHHLYAWMKSQKDPHSLSFYRTKSGSEVDFYRLWTDKFFGRMKLNFRIRFTPKIYIH